MATAPQPQLKPTIREPGPRHPPFKIPMPTGHPVPQLSRRTATPRTRNTNTNAYGTTGSVTTTNGGKAYGASGANNSVAVGQTANGDKYAAANGNIYKNTGAAGKAQVRTRIRSTTLQATPPRKAAPITVAGDSRKRVADLRPLTAEAAAGRLGRQVRAAQQVAVAVVGGEVAGDANNVSTKESNRVPRWC